MILLSIVLMKLNRFLSLFQVKSLFYRVPEKVRSCLFMPPCFRRLFVEVSAREEDQEKGKDLRCSLCYLAGVI